MKIGLLFLAGFMLSVYLISFASAAIQQSNIEIIISGSKALVSYDIQTDQSAVQLIVPKDAKINEISEEDYSLNNGLLTVQTSKNLKISYFTDNFIEKTSKSYFTADFKTVDEVQNLNVRLILPEFSTSESAFPTPVITSDGKHIILNWKDSLKAQESFPVFVIYQEKGSQWIWIAGIAIVLIIAAIFIIKHKPKVIKVKSKGKSKEKTKEIEQHLLESESSVIKTIRKSKGEAWQKQIQLNTGFSKAKLSRTIRNLEARGLVKRIPLGNTNKIRLLK